jgi:peptidoglycan/xylan/chitin deacetylase (PgdA/CDA1 family)
MARGKMMRVGLCSNLRFVSQILMVALTLAGAAGAQQVAITFDDLPAHSVLPPGETRLEVANQVIRALKRANVPPTYGFVNGIHVQEQPDTIGVLGAWRAAGNPLGNHTWSHMNLNQNSLAAFEEDTTHNEQVLRLQMDGGDWHWLRYPYLAEGDTPEKQMGVRAFLSEHGYRIAGVTMSFGDYEWNEPYARCSEKNNRKAIVWLEHSYLKAADDDIAYGRAMAKALYGNDIPYVLLMHIGAFDARMLPRLLAQYKRRGFSFISLGDAEENPFYKYDTNPKLLPGADTLEGAMIAKHLPLPKHEDFSAQLNAVCR